MSFREEFEEHVERSLHRIAKAIEAIVQLLTQQPGSSVAQSAILTFTDAKGNKIMPATLTVGQTANSVFTEFTGLNGTGVVIAPIGPVTFSSSAPLVATVDPASGLVTAVGPGTATITATDSGNGLSASDSVSDTALVAQSATLVITAN
jgi:uncharacterized protein YjdB